MGSDLIVIAVAGASGSGKSLLSHTIVDELGSEYVTVITEDSYYKDHSNMSFEELQHLNYDHPNAFDHDLLVSHLQALKAGKSIEVPIYDYATHRRIEKARAVTSSQRIVVLEGILLLNDAQLRELTDIKIFVDTPMDISFIRRLKRDVLERGRTMESVITQYENTVRPMFLKFIEPSKRYADIIVPHGGKNRIAIEMIQAKMRDLLQTGAVKPLKVVG